VSLVVFGLVFAGSALALTLTAGNIVVHTDGGFTPTKLPRHEFAPIRLHGYGKITTADDSPPPVLKLLTIWFDRHGKVETRGLPVCPMSKLVATTPSQARRNCPEAIVGEGTGKAVVNFPEQAPIPASSPITIFNAPPKNGNPSVYAHAYTTVGGPSTYVIQVVIQKVNDGRYGFKLVADVPKIVNGYGTPVYGKLKIGKTWSYEGKTLSYANASCPDGHLQAKAKLQFGDGTRLEGTFLKPCTPAG
jgi:hypothetical protein